jgi:hypothetical protein
MKHLLLLLQHLLLKLLLLQLLLLKHLLLKHQKLTLLLLLHLLLKKRSNHGQPSKKAVLVTAFLLFQMSQYKPSSRAPIKAS